VASHLSDKLHKIEKAQREAAAMKSEADTEAGCPPDLTLDPGSAVIQQSISTG
jgi:hypothetical protein